MKRHASLQPLSRFHRSILFLALVAKENGPDLRGYPTDVEGKVDYALSFYADQLLPHFMHEEAQLYKQVREQDPMVKALIAELEVEREQLADLFRALRQTRSAATLHEIGVLLETHVRKEERQLFQKIQEVCDDTLLNRLRC